mgnify:CR=1 FL=1
MTKIPKATIYPFYEYLVKLLLLTSVWYVYAPSIGSKSTDGGNRILVKIDAADVQVTCSIDTDGLPLKNFAWFECPNMEQMKQCRKDRDKYRKAWIKNGTVINHYPEEYKLSVNRTLSILKISPKYDGTVFLCIGEIEYHEALENTTIIQIIKGRIMFPLKLYSSLWKWSKCGQCLHSETTSLPLPFPPSSLRARQRRLE